MFRAFNSFQITAIFAALPFILSWVATAQFPGHGIAFWVGCVIYLVLFVVMTVAVFAGMDKLD